MTKVFLLVAAISIAQLIALQLHGRISNNMVFQTGETMTVLGTTVGESVTVDFKGADGRVISSITAPAQNRAFAAVLPAVAQPGGPFVITITEKPTNTAVTIKNVMIGELYVCSGQSNMEWPTRATWEAQREIDDSDNYPNLRFLTVNRLSSPTPVDTITARGWSVSHRTVTGEFSAVCYFFGRALQKRLGVPVGLVASSWGGTPIEHWISAEGFRQCPDVKPSMVLYNGMIHPIRHMKFKGALWYQGESNAGAAPAYACLLPAMVRDWRRVFGTKLHFLNVQLAGWVPGDFRLLRWVQWTTRSILENYDLATAVDLGEEQDIHPRKKLEVGERLELAAANRIYGRPVAFLPPLFGKAVVTRNNDHVTLRIPLENYSSEALTMKPTQFCTKCCAESELKTVFQLFDKDGREHQIVKYALENGSILLDARVPVPQQPAMQWRYAWHNFPQCMYFSEKSNLPLYPHAEILQ
jgi:sialate O-acetylesterase